jgi:hypothetical protein
MKRLEVGNKWLAERKQEKRKRRWSAYLGSAREKQVRGKGCRLHFSHLHPTRHYLIETKMCSALSTLQEDRAYLPDKYNALSHTISHKLTAHEHQVEVSSPPPPSYTMRTNQQCPTAPGLSACNSYSMLTKLK